MSLKEWQAMSQADQEKYTTAGICPPCEPFHRRERLEAGDSR